MFSLHGVYKQQTNTHGIGHVVFSCAVVVSPNVTNVDICYFLCGYFPFIVCKVPDAKELVHSVW